MTKQRLDKAIQLVGALVLLMGVLVTARLHTATPPKLSVVPMTETSIKENYKIEDRIRRLKVAKSQAEKVYRRHGCGSKYAAYTGEAAIDFGVSPRILAALVFVESSCNPNAKDGLGSYGLTQVNSRVWGQKALLKDPQTSIRIGAKILGGYISRFGLVEGLHHYNGYSEVHEHVYVNKVLEAANGKS